MVSILDKIKTGIKDYAKTGWKVALLQAMIVLAYLGVIMVAGYLFGDISAPKVNSFMAYLIFPITLVIIFILYLVLNGVIAQKVFKWK